MIRKSKPRIYVAHSLGIRDEVKENVFPKLKKFGFEIDDPFDNRREFFEGKSPEEIREELKELMTPHWIVSHDIDSISHCDGLIAIQTNGTSPGTIIESWEAAKHFKIPVSMVVTEKLKNHPWLNEYAICVTTNTDHAITSLAKWFGLV